MKRSGIMKLILCLFTLYTASTIYAMVQPANISDKDTLAALGAELIRKAAEHVKDQPNPTPKQEQIASSEAKETTVVQRIINSIMDYAIENPLQVIGAVGTIAIPITASAISLIMQTARKAPYVKDISLIKPSAETIAQEQEQKIRNIEQEIKGTLKPTLLPWWKKPFVSEEPSLAKIYGLERPKIPTEKPKKQDSRFEGTIGKSTSSWGMPRNIDFE